MLELAILTAACFIAGSLLVWAFVDGYRSVAREDAPADRLADTVRLWLDDERPAWETVEAFERDVERVMRGKVTAEPVSRMPLRTRTIKAADGHTVKLREPIGHQRATATRYSDAIRPKTTRCRHRWTTIPPRSVDLFATINGGKPRLPDMYVGRSVPAWCVKCRTRKDGKPLHPF